MRAVGSSSTALVPLDQGCLKSRRTLPPSRMLNRSWASGGLGMYLHGRGGRASRWRNTSGCLQVEAAGLTAWRAPGDRTLIGVEHDADGWKRRMRRPACPMPLRTAGATPLAAGSSDWAVLLPPGRALSRRGRTLFPADHRHLRGRAAPARRDPRRPARRLVDPAPATDRARRAGLHRTSARLRRTNASFARRLAWWSPGRVRSSFTDAGRIASAHRSV